MTVKEKVQIMLERHPKLRDCDNKLLSFYWLQELKQMKINPEKMTGMDLLHLYSQKKLQNAATVRRERAKIQEDNVHLRGLSYKEKQTKKQDIVLNAMGYAVRN